MIADITQWILEAIRANGAWSVFLGVLVEQVIVPIPSPAIIMGAGFILIPADALWTPAIFWIITKIVIPGSIASALGAILGYYVGLWGGKKFVTRFQRFLGFDWTDVRWMGRRITTKGTAITLFFMRALPIVPLSLVSIVSGVIKAPFSVFLLWSFLGSIPRCFMLALLGWQLGSSASALAHGFERFESIISVGIVVLVILVVFYLRQNVRKAMKGEKAFK